ncbi:hypothetical protein GBAR_LOCUS16191 [Geodia barretti]|uniref:Uncharacterized protein n=1 Tax=Geodia barretti TaxID=519541 RepID=A0AA35WTH7_GEOBA|nr:hypothetical protein GBAR_LOCUS16191 [Geodia barretti]
MALSRVSRSNVMELMRMTLYVFFPVGVFYYFNAPGYFDQKIEKKRVEIFPKGNKPPLTFEESKKLQQELRKKRREARHSTNIS